MTKKIPLLSLLIPIILFSLSDVLAQQPPPCSSQYKTDEGRTLPCESKMLSLGNSNIEVRIFTKKTTPGQMFNKTFAVVHNDEQTGLNVVKELIAENGGRLVEVISNPVRQRYLTFKIGAAKVCIDPNRIYTPAGLASDLRGKKDSDGSFAGNRCGKLNNTQLAQAETIIKSFAADLQNIIQDKSGANYKFIVAVHNNDPGGCLTFFAFDRAKPSGGCSDCDKGEFEIQTEKVSAGESEIDNFILVSTPALFDAIKNKGFNLILQVAKEKLAGTADDGSMSVYAAQNDIRYIILETQCKNNSAACADFRERQKKMAQAVHALE